MRARPLLAVLIGALTLAALVGASTKAAAGRACVGDVQPSGYSYAGHQATYRGHGVRATITMTRAALDRFILGEATLDAEAQSGEIRVEPGIAPLDELLSLLDTFAGWFNIIEP